MVQSKLKTKRWNRSISRAHRVYFSHRSKMGIVSRSSFRRVFSFRRLSEPDPCISLPLLAHVGASINSDNSSSGSDHNNGSSSSPSAHASSDGVPRRNNAACSSTALRDTPPKVLGRGGPHSDQCSHALGTSASFGALSSSADASCASSWLGGGYGTGVDDAPSSCRRHEQRWGQEGMAASTTTMALHGNKPMRNIPSLSRVGMASAYIAVPQDNAYGGRCYRLLR